MISLLHVSMICSKSLLIYQIYFEENPRDAEVLRHDTALLPQTKVKPHLKTLPEYLLPKGVEQSRGGPKKQRNPKYFKSKGVQARQRRDANPLKSFKFNKGKTSEKK